MHCFTESLAVAEAAMELGFYISFSGIVTFKSARELQDVARAVPLDRLLIETDSPYLAPVPYRGKTNEPSYVPKVAEKMAELKKLSVETVAACVNRQFHESFQARARNSWRECAGNTPITRRAKSRACNWSLMSSYSRPVP